MGMGSKKTVIGYEYNGTVHSGIGLAMDELYQINIGDKTAWTGSIKQNGSIFIDKYNLFGGKKGEGGVRGTLDVMFGGAEQGQNGNLTRYLGNKIPAFRGTVTTVFSGMLAAMNWYPKTWNFYYRRIKSGWPDNMPFYPETIEISLANGQIKAMNPAHILYESYISNTWGAGIPRAMMDDEAYKQVADTLYNEGFGLCFEWKATDDLKKLREYVCSHIDAVLGTDPKTGKNTIRLIRDDYAVEDLPVFDEDTGLLEIKLQTSNNTEVPSQIIVKFNDAITFQERTAYATNPAVAQGQIGRNTETNEYLGIPIGELATRVAYRDLKAKTSGIKSASIKLDRRAYDIVNGQPFRIKTKYRANNIDLVVRATKRKENFLTDGSITMDVVQDVFSTPKVAFMPIPDAPNRPEPQPPVPIIYSRLLEATYRDLVSIVDPANLEKIDSSSSFIYAVAQSPANQCYSYDIVSRVKGSASFSEADDTGTWCATALIASDIGYFDTIIHIQDGQLLEDVEIGSAALIDDEIVRIDGLDLANNQITLGRGCVDTVPTKHSKGVMIWFIDSSETTDGVEYSYNNNVEIKLLPNTFRERLEQSQAETKAINVQARQGRPYPPGNLKINGAAYPEKVNAAALNITWSGRHRLLQADKLIDTTATDTGEEANTRYNLTVYLNDTLYKKEQGLTAKDYSFTLTTISEHQSLLHFDNNIIDEAGTVWTNNGVTFENSPDKPFNQQAIFDNNRFIQTTDNKNLSIGAEDDFTFSFWIEPTSLTNSYATIIANGYSSWSAGACFINLWGENSPNSTLSSKIGLGSRESSYEYGYTSILSNTIIEAGKRYHVAITRSKGTIRLFLNGVLDAERTGNKLVFDFSRYGKTAIGRDYNNPEPSCFLQAKLDEFLFTKQALYTTNFIPPTEPYSNSGETRVKVELEAERDGLVSYQKHSYSFKAGE
ncbi:hypothetical protein DM558_07500 [Entomomonas moraniae]|uniref:Tip attachment protein J domain-containing protein n=1 Tax=Entomomonas moraniae TaxID=2213226 RepID=A0A3Q9JIU9_9GAMM|nr:LamG domain-containing protein [Entomomonas moraniae]AZS50632.1 hypothetical protein DM558_07500 [Entomomonas moraniae]